MVNTACLSGKIYSNKTHPQTDETPARLEDSSTTDSIPRPITLPRHAHTVSHLAVSFGLRRL